MALEHLDRLREMKQNRPFVAFRIVATSGEEYLVEDRFQFAVGQSRIMYARPKSGGTVHLSADQIAAVKVVEQKPAA